MKLINKIIFAMALMMVIILNPISVKATEDIPGIHSSFLKYNAENHTVSGYNKKTVETLS